MPPFEWIDQKTLLFHHMPQKFAMPALQGSAARIRGVGALRHLIIDAGHLHRFSRGEFVKAQVHGATAIVARTLRRVGYENLLVFGSSVPEYFCHIPRPVGVMNQ